MFLLDIPRGNIATTIDIESNSGSCYYYTHKNGTETTVPLLSLPGTCITFFPETTTAEDDSDDDNSDDGSDFDLPNFDTTEEEEEYYGTLYRFWSYNDMSRTLMILVNFMIIIQ